MRRLYPLLLVILFIIGLAFFALAGTARAAPERPASPDRLPAWDGDGAPPVREPLPTNVEVIPAACPYSPAPACSDGTRIWASPVGDPLNAVFHVRHEMGHVQDHRHYTPGVRNKLTRLLGFPAGTQWSQGTWPQIDRSPEEVAADAFANCSLGLQPDGPVAVLDAYGYDPTRKQARLVCGTIRRALMN